MIDSYIPYFKKWNIEVLGEKNVTLFTRSAARMREGTIFRLNVG